jgi:ATP/maltotriose-dependent transcriptional regulator MalT
MSEVRSPQSVFVGRQAEIDAAARRVKEALDQRSSVIWVEGEAGLGKTALARRIVADLPPGTSTLWIEADELAADVPYGLASQIAPVDDPSPFGAGMALLAHLADRQAAGLVVVVIEDLHWADELSRQALLTVARRLGEDRVVLIVTSRPTPQVNDGWERLIRDETRCLSLRLGPWGTDEVREWASQAHTELSIAQAERLCHHAQGQPLYVRTLLSELTVDQLRSAESDLPAPRSLAATTLGALGGVKPEAQRLVAALAVAGTRTPLAELAQVADVDEPIPALEELLATGIVRWWSGEASTPVDFSHPLFRAAVYDDMAPTLRQELHRSMADHVGQVEGWRHRVASADGPDDELADELESGADASLDRGETTSAVRYLLWAAPLTTSTETAESRLLRAALLLANGNQPDRLEGLIPRVRACSPSRVRDLVLGAHASARGELLAAEELLREAARSPRDGEIDEPTVRADALAHLSLVYINRAMPVAAGEAATEALALDATSDATTRMAWSARAIGEANTHGAGAGLVVLQGRLPDDAAAVDGADVDLLLTRAMIALHHDCVGVVDDLRATIELVRRGAGGAAQLARAHVVLAEALERGGAWDDAVRNAHAGQELIELTGHDWYRGRPEAAIGAIAAARGEIDQARAILDQSAAAMRVTKSPWTRVHHAQSVAVLATVDGGHEAALDVMCPLVADRHPAIAIATVTTWWPTLIVLLVMAGRLDDAADHIEQFEERTADLDVFVAGRITGVRALLASARRELDEADELFAQALAITDASDVALERALLHHEWGRVLRARKQRREATDQFRAAHEAFVALGAEPFRRAVEEDLATYGVRGLATSSRSSLTFTDREQDVLALVSQGLSNRAIAGELYVSEKAVEYHLRNIYGKVGVRTRRELLALDLATG